MVKIKGGNIMKDVVDYLKKHKQYKHDVMGRDFELELDGNVITLRFHGHEWWIAVKPNENPEYVIQDILEDEYKIEIRFCEECGKPFDAGFMAGDGDWYCCEECFESSMDESYGKGNWRGTDEEGVCGGFYEHLNDDEWLDTGVFYTEWY
jgi:hypothetical protein